jgi:hypothetical protein
MALRCPSELSDQQRQELCHARDHHAKPYLRVKAAAILKVAAGLSRRAVARQGLLKPVAEETVSRGVQTYLREGLEGLLVKKGRGRKPAFSPCAPLSRAGQEPSRRPAASLSPPMWSRSVDLDAEDAAPSGGLDAAVHPQWHVPDLTAL